jgi:putative cardiolipin synthase
MPTRRLIPGIALLAVVAGCTQLEPRPELPVESAVPAGEGGTLDKIFAEAESARPRDSAFRLVIEGTEAFAIRIGSARVASRSIDVQTYIWHDDQTGRLLANELIAAADRGVKVRLLIDDMDARAKNLGLAAMAAHSHIDIRLFNPFASRSGTLGFLREGLTSFDRINRRMHNKTWIADNRISIAGGRNLGDEYFSASDEVNFVDLDFAMVGPIVRDASASFDKYWNSPSAYPMEVLDPERVTPAALEKLREALSADRRAAESSRYAAALRSDDSVNRLAAGDWPMQWASKYEFISDDPRKVTMQQRDRDRAVVGASLVPVVQATREDITIISPYFVPGDATTASLAGFASAGKRVRILTNSLIANDVAAVHGGYSRHRRALLEGGVHLWELKPLTEDKVDSSVFGSSGASLHTKGLSVDDDRLFVGSYNLDPRSTWLNCEQGVLVENATLVRQFRAIFDKQTSGQHAWHVTLQDGRMNWTDGNETFDSDPKATAGKRFQAWITRVLHLDAQL